jgi:hypothetical protein
MNSKVKATVSDTEAARNLSRAVRSRHEFMQAQEKGLSGKAKVEVAVKPLKKEPPKEEPPKRAVKRKKNRP